MRFELKAEHAEEVADILDEFVPGNPEHKAKSIIKTRNRQNYSYWTNIADDIRRQLNCADPNSIIITSTQMTSEIKRIGTATREQVVEALKQSTDTKADAFANTFIGKADKQDMWDKCKGVFNENNELMAMIITTVTKRLPKSANLQLMHTFAKHRRKGIGKLLVDDALDHAAMEGCEYFRVSAERTAVGFYAKCGIPFLGMQKSGTFLSLFSLQGSRSEITSFIHDKAFHRNGRLNVERCDNPTEREKQTIEQLDDKYLYESLTAWVPPIYDDENEVVE